MRRNHGLFIALGMVLMGAVATGCLSDITVGDRRYGSYYGDDYSSPSSGVPEPGPPQALNFGPTTHQDDPPPPISGGTLAVTPDGQTVVVADPDRDAIYIVDLATRGVKTIKLDLHDEPGRIALDGLTPTRAYVALRRGGAIVAIDLPTATIATRVVVCPMPRGIVWDATASLVRVACAGGELVTMAAGLTGSAPQTTRIDGLTDLRDIVVTPEEGVVVSTFRSAEVAKLTPTGTAIERWRMAHITKSAGTRRVAWKTMAAKLPSTMSTAGGAPVPAEKQELVMVAQVAGNIVVDVPAQYYGSNNSTSRNGATTIVTVGESETIVPAAVLPVDVALNDKDVVVVSAGNAHHTDRPQLVVLDRPDPKAPTYSRGNSYIVPTPSSGWGQLTSIAFTPNGKNLVAFSREPARLYVLNAPLYNEIPVTLDLSTISRKDTGHDIFHTNSGAGMACASCHPEGRDDGHAWTSADLGARRTPSLIGTIANTAPYHWNGEATSMTALATMTFTTRMLGPQLDIMQLTTLETWLGALPALPASAAIDAASAARGKVLFEGSGKCSGCHSGSALTNNASIDVRTGGSFQVPSLLGVAHRAPYLHDGSATSIQTLLQTEQHHGSILTAAEITDVSTFLQTL